MPLEKYRAKRDFEATPEPSGDSPASKADADEGTVPAPAGALLYVIQKHDASRLHYDFRLELDGVLLSWAVPKGPSLNPSDKRLAVRVEDHPVDYGGFEGTIPKGEYGGGTVELWDRGTWEPEGDARASLEKGDFKFTLHGEKLKGSWVLVHMKPRNDRDGDDNWLLIKHRDEHARDGDGDSILLARPESVLTGRTVEQIAAEAERADQGRESATAQQPPIPPDPASADGAKRVGTLPETVAPQLATLVSTAPRGDTWLHEIKFDGYRTIANIGGGQVRMYSRNGLDWSARYAPIAEALSVLPATSAVLDGEVIVQKENGVSDFGSLQAALSTGHDERLRFAVFDLLHLDGYDLTTVPLRERKKLLAALLGQAPSPIVEYVDDVAGQGPAFFAQACAHGLEGIVSKRTDSPYRPGSRGRDWVKVKCLNRQEFVIVGFTPPGGSRTGFGALLLGEHTPDGTLGYVGRVGTGFSASFLDEFGKRLRAMEQEAPTVDQGIERAPKGSHWVTPRFVAEVAFTERTASGTLRHPSFKGLREDKTPADVVAERPSAPVPTGRLSAALEAGRAEDTPSGAVPAEVALTNPQRVFWPQTGTTKRDLADYYAMIAPRMLPYVLHRPISMVRCPNGVDAVTSGEHPGVASCFFHKHPGENFPGPFERVEIVESKGPAEYLAISGADSLTALAQMGVLEIHTWGSTWPDIEHPDVIVFDLDPDDGVDWAALADAARLVRDALDGLGLKSFVKTTGGKGLHVSVPVVPARSWDEIKRFAKSIADGIAAFDPRRYVATMSKARRTGRVYVDYLRNSRTATFIAPYSTRARSRPTVAVPLRWDELDGDTRPDTFHIDNLGDRLAGLDDDPWNGYFELRQSITEDMMGELGLK